jgi:hypothetical protein
VNLNGGTLRIRDAGNGLAGAETLVYGNNVTLAASSFLDLDRPAANTVATNKTIAFGSLTVAAGTHVLNTAYSQGNPILGNGYRGSFTSLDGPGTLVKGGTRAIDIDSIGGSFSGNIEIAGPQGFALSASGNLALLPATSNLNNLTVHGFHDFPAGRAVTIANTLEVGNNSGQVANGLGGVNTGSTVGSIAVNNTATVSAAVLRNNGIIGSNNSPAVISAASIRGNGTFHAYGQDLTLDGAFADDGPTPTTIKVTGTSSTTAVVLTASTSGNTGGTEVQGGALRIVPTSGSANNPLGTGPIRVYGAPATALAANSQPVAALNAVLEFAGTNVIQSGNISNSGTVRVSAGTATVLGVIQGRPDVGANLADFQAATVPGLLEGRFTSNGGLPDTNAAGRSIGFNREPNPGNFGVRLEPRMTQTNVVTQNPITGWTDNTAWIYTGYFYDADGIFTFMENLDDSTLVSIDGVDRIVNNSGTNPWQTVTSTATTKGQRGGVIDFADVNTGTPQGLSAIPNNPNLPAGWHTIEIRIDNGGGGGGAVPGNGFSANYGVGLNPNGTMALDGGAAFRPIDPGDGTLFRTAFAGKGSVQVDADATLNVQGFTNMSSVTFNGGFSSGFANLYVATSNSDTDHMALTGFVLPKASLNIDNNLTVTVNNSFTVVAGGTFTAGGGGEGRLVINGPNVINTTFGDPVALDVFSGTVVIGPDSTGSGGGRVQVNVDATLVVNGSLSGALDVLSEGILKGGGIINGATTLGLNSVLSPGDTIGTLTFTAPSPETSLTLGANSIYIFEAGSTGVDGVDLLGGATTLTIAGNWTLRLRDLGFGNPTGTTFVLFDGDVTAAPLNAGLVGSPTIDLSATLWAGGSISYDALNNDIILTGVVPEPGSVALLLGGLGLLAAGRRRRGTENDRP